MLQQPKRVKYRKPQKRRIGRIAQRGYTLSFGDIGVKALEPAKITARQIEAARVTITRTVKREGAIYQRIFPYMSYTSKPQEVRMGKGKGNPDHFGARVRPGTMLYEIGGVNMTVAHRALWLASKKLPIKTRIVYREDYQKE